MTISNDTTTRVQISSGSTITIIDLEIQDSSQVLVTKTDSSGVESTLVITTDYTVNADLDTVTLLVALGASELATATLSVTNTQNTDFINFDPLNSENIEDGLDKLTLKNKQQEEVLDRSVKFSITTDDTNIELPDPTNNSDKYVKLNSDSSAFEYVALSDGSGIGNVVDDVSPQYGGNTDQNTFKLFNDSGDVQIADGTDLTKLLNISLSGATTAKTIDLVSSHTDDRVITLPNATDTLVGKATTDTLTNKTLTSPVLNGTLSGTGFLDEDDLLSDSAIAAASQQSIKAYVDGKSASQADQETGTSTADFVTPGVQQFHPSSAKTWGIVTWSAGTPSLGQSYNVSSIVDTGAGVVTINHDTDFAAVDYGAVVCGGGNASNMGIGVISSRTTGTLEITNSRTESPYTNIDPTRAVGFSCFGDQ